MDAARPSAAIARTRPFFVALLLAVTATFAFVSVAAAAWTREAAPGIGAFFQSNSSMSVLPDGSVRYIAASGSGSLYTNQVVVRPPAGPATLATPFPSSFGQASSDDILALSPQDASGNQLVVRGRPPYGVSFLAPAGNPAAAVVEETNRVTAVDLAPSGEGAAIVSSGSEAWVRWRPAGPGAVFDAPRLLDRAGNQRSYGVAVTVDPDGGVYVIYETQQDSALLQAYAPPGQPFDPPVPIDVDKTTISRDAFSYGQSSNGHGVFAWDEDTGGSDSNPDVVWAMTRAPGGLLGNKRQVTTARPNGSLSVGRVGATDDGAAYVAYLDTGPSVCPNNAREGGSVLAVKGAGDSEWTKLNEPASGKERTELLAIETAGNAVGTVRLRSTRVNDLCTDKDFVSSLEVQLGQGASLGAPEVVASENILGSISTMVSPRGFAVNAAGAAALLVEEPVDTANHRVPYLYTRGGGGGGSPLPAPVTKPLPAPGKIKLSGRKLVARGNEISFDASCTKLPGHGDKSFCSIAAILLMEEKLKNGAKAKGSIASASSKAKKEKKAKPKLKVIATARPVRVPVGKTKAIRLKLNKFGKKKLAAAKKAGLKVTLKVTIKRQGYATNTIERKTKLVAGKGKGKGKKK